VKLVSLLFIYLFFGHCENHTNESGLFEHVSTEQSNNVASLWGHRVHLMCLVYKAYKEKRLQLCFYQQYDLSASCQSITPLVKFI